MDDISKDAPPEAALLIAAEAAAATEKNTESDEESTSGATSTLKVFAWVAAILINASFIALVAWGTFENWPIGFAFAVSYSAALLVAGYSLKRRNGGRDSVLTSLLFLLAVVAIAGTGVYIPSYTFSCSEEFSFFNNDHYVSTYDGWVIKEMENLPSNVQSWWNTKNPSLYPVATFAYFSNTGITLFSGTDGASSHEKLWKQTPGKVIEAVPNMLNPASFIFVGETSTACFLFYDNNKALSIDESVAYKKIACANDGVKISISEEKFRYPSDLIYSNDLIWFRTYTPPESGHFGELLYSADPSNLNQVTLYSSYITKSYEDPTKDEDDECYSNRAIRTTFAGLLFLSATPSLITVFVISFLQKIPSMSVGGYLSVTWLVVCLVSMIAPSFSDFDVFFRWWSVFTSGPWLILLVLAHLTNRMTKGGLTWGINFAAVVYTIGMFILLEVFSEDMFWRWAVLTIGVIPPLLLISVITGQIILMILASIVILVDVYKLTSLVGFGESFPVQFIVLGLSGLALGFLGFLFSKKQSQFQTAVSARAKSTLGRWVYYGEEADGNNNHEDEIQDDTGDYHEKMDEENVDGTVAPVT